MQAKLIFGVAIAAALLLALWAYTDWQREDAKAVERNETMQATTQTIDQVQEIKNEIRNRPISDHYTIERLRAGTW